MTVPTGDIAAFLNGAVSEAILIAERLDADPSLDPPPPSVTTAWLRVCVLEQALAATHHGDADGWFARRGAVMAATKAGARELGRELVRHYSVEPGACADLFADMDGRYQWAAELAETLRLKRISSYGDAALAVAAAVAAQHEGDSQP